MVVTRTSLVAVAVGRGDRQRKCFVIIVVVGYLLMDAVLRMQESKMMHRYLAQAPT